MDSWQKCPACGGPCQLLATLNEFENYCPKCDIRFNRRGEMIDKFPQQDMFAHQYAGTTPRVAGSDTSALAGDSVLGSARSKRRAVYEHICASGGATDDEVEVALDMMHQTASARRRELVLSGAVRDSGARRNTRSGRAATVWVEV